ncbi:DUF4861 family protein [Steroidobacter agaridevorans]|uniref:DUF4861 family protein n=1 Tax=Steroidobacter agaridevorans TaxID=2695856 RepID=UPI0013294524|nr:DUF4861 family protein [Steroidobacter agaridevorans]GFE85258.1 hypothetical protein GCM10011488_02120 [Steroidobacter agaridevorans]
MLRKLDTALFALLCCAGIVHAQTLPDVALPAVEKPLAPPPTREALAVAVLADYRYDDLLWENDLTAHRIYGHALEAAEPPSGSGIDSWGKNVAWPFADRQLRTGDQHAYHGEGLDFYNVGTSRGAGGLGIWYDNKLWTSRNFIRHRILSSGGKLADFEVDYAPWPVSVDRKVWETRRFTLPLGSHFTRLVSTISSDKPEPLTVGIGIGKRTTGGNGELTIDRSRGLLSWWGPEDGTHGRMAVAIRVDPRTIIDVGQDADNHLVFVKVTPDQPFVYYSGSAWNKGNGGFRERAAWDRYAANEQLDFTGR